MSLPDLAELIFDVVGCMNMVFIIVLIIVKERRNQAMKRLFSAAALHFFSVLTRTAIIIDKTFGDSALRPGFTITESMLDNLSAIAIVLCILTDRKGKISVYSWRDSFFPPKLAFLVMPFLTALGLEMFFSGYHFIDFGYTCTFSLFYILLQRQSERELAIKEEKISASQARLLTDQIQPHFIFNSLMAIEDLCYSDPEKAAKCIEDFSGYLRGNIDALTSEQPILFEEELRHIRQYVALEHARNSVGFRIVYDLKETEFKIPALTIQPIVENAIKHGALTRRDGTGEVRLSTERTGSFIRVIVEDNGIKTELTEAQQKHKSIGLNNVSERLKTQSGGSLKLNITEKGARAVIVIPVTGK